MTNFLHPIDAKSHQSHSDAVEITLRYLDGTSCQRSAARRKNGAFSGDDTPTVTSRQLRRRAIFVSGDVRFQDGDVVDLKQMGLSVSFSSSSFLRGLNLR